ncbi:DUF2975 domain-containing protein [Flavobacterium foetidum]|uniref:DUF2975 domain-containing protein n=1 Tax=Flavobacterium foetidum TaxID=2026681 RepID=UPI001074F279|nr:DUF2975 domain-containing protein [Flavobacterium foetidum]KAF2514530.1 DUF2975 domain-containing protein [Flavobacterium foetidum]
MNPIKHFASLLYFAVLFAIIAYSFSLVTTVLGKFFGNDGQFIIKNGNSTIVMGNKTSEGYYVPVALTLQIPDTIRKNQGGIGVHAADSYPQITRTYLEDNKVAKAINLYNVSSESNRMSVGSDGNGNYLHKQSNRFKFIKYAPKGDSAYLKMLTNEPSTNAMLAIREHLNSLILILKMIFLALILRELAKEIYFSKSLSTYIKRLGYVFLFSQLVPIIYSFLDTNLFGYIMIEPQVLASLQDVYFQNLSVTFNPTLDIEFYAVLLGSILVLLTKLIERGRSLEEENELTI